MQRIVNSNPHNHKNILFPARRGLCPSHKPPTGWQQKLPKKQEKLFHMTNTNLVQ